MTGINTDEGVILEALNAKVDVDLHNANPDQAFKEQSVGWGMPSNKYINISYTGEGQRYTAPAKGWVYLNVKSGLSTTSYSALSNVTIGTADVRFAYGSTVSDLTPLIAVKKGDVIAIGTNATGVLVRFRFYYAGEN